MAEENILRYVREDNGQTYEFPESRREEFLQIAKENNIGVSELKDPLPKANPETPDYAPADVAPFYRPNAQPDNLVEKNPTYGAEAKLQANPVQRQAQAEEPVTEENRAKPEDFPLANPKVQEIYNKANQKVADEIGDIPTINDPMVARERREKFVASQMSKAGQMYTKEDVRKAADQLEEQEELNYFNNYITNEFTEDDLRTHRYVEDKLAANEADGADGFIRDKMEGITPEQYSTYLKIEQSDKEFFNSPIVKRVIQRETDRAKKNLSDISAKKRAYMDEKGATRELVGQEGKVTAFFDNPDDIPEYNALDHAERLARQSLQQWQAGSRYDRDFFSPGKQYVKGHVDRMSDRDWWGAVGGFTELRRNNRIRDIGEKLERAAWSGNEDPTSVLTDGELELLKQYYYNAETNAARSRDISRAYKAGQVSADALPFMVDFLLTDGATTAVKEAVAKALGNKFFGKSMGGLIGAAARTAMMPTSYTNASRQQLERNPDGSFKYDRGKAWAVGMLDSAIETLSESFGAGLEKFGLGKMIGNKLSGSKVGSTIYDILHGTNDVLRMGGFNGLAGEWVEELYGTLLRMTLPQYYGNSKEQWSDFWSADNQATMLGGFAAMSGIGAITNISNRIKTEKGYREELQKIKAEQEKYRGSLYDALSGLGVSDDKINKLVKGLYNKTIEEAGNEFDGLLAETRKSYKGKEYGKYVQMRRQAREDYENLVRATAEQGLVEAAKKEAVEAARGEIDKEDMLFDWDAIAERRQQRREERAERGPISDYMQPIVPADMVAPSANEPVAPVQEPQTQQPAQQEPGKPDLVKMFKDRHNGATLPVDAEGNVTPVMKDGKVVGYMKGSTNRGITGNKVITFLEQGKDDRWSTRTVSESQGYTLGKPITADEAYNTVLAPVMLAQQEAANAQQAVVSSDAQDTAQTIDAAQADVAANIDAQNEEAAKAVDSAEQSLDEAQKNLDGAAPQNTNNQQEGQTPPPANDEEAFMESLPRKGKGKELDYAAFTPEQTVRYTAMQSDLATAIEDARATVAQRQQEIAELNDKIGKAVGTDRLALRAQTKALADEIAAYEGIINEYQDTVGAAAPAEPVAAPQPAPALKTTSRRQSRKPAEKPAEAAAPVAPAAPVENKVEEPKAAPQPKAEPAPKKEKKASPVETPKAEPVAGLPKKYASIKKELAAAQNKKEEKEPKRKLSTFLRKATDEELIAVLEDVRNMVSNGEKMNGLNSLIYQLERELEKRNDNTSEAISNLQTEIASLSSNTSSEATAEQAAEAPKEEKKETRKRKSEKKETTATEPAAEQTEAETEEPVEEVSIAGEVSGMLDRLEAAYTEDAEAGNTDTSKAAYAEIRERVNQATSANELQAISAQLQDEGDGLMVEDSKGNRASTNDERTHAINSLKDMVERRRSYITNGYGKKMRKSDGSLTKIGKKVQREAAKKRKSEQAKRDAEGAAANKAAAQEALASVKANAEARAQAEQAKKDEKANARKRVEQGMAVKKSTEEPAAESAVEKVTKPARQRALEALDAAANLEIDSDEAYNTALKLKRDIDSLAKRGVDKKERGTGITNDIKARLKDASEKLSSDLNMYKNSQGRSLDEILDEENKEHAEATRWRSNEEQVEDLKKQLEAKRVELDKLERIKSLGDRVDDGDAIGEGVEASSKVDDDIEATRQEIRNIKGKIRKLGGEYRTNAEIVADDIKAKEKEIVDINREIGKIPAAKRVSEALVAQDELKRRADNGDEDAAKAYSTNIKIINNANNRAFYDELAGLYKRLFPNASTTDQAFRDWLDSRYEELSDERSDINSQIMRLHDEARKEISGGEGRKATLKEIGRLTNQLMKFLPASMRDKVRVLSHEEFMKQLQKSDGARQQMAYHGSGALFDHFDHAFMSTGEGAQAYGWGTYVSMNRSIAEAYANARRRYLDFDISLIPTREERKRYEYLKKKEHASWEKERKVDNEISELSLEFRHLFMDKLAEEGYSEDDAFNVFYDANRYFLEESWDATDLLMEIGDKYPALISRAHEIQGDIRRLRQDWLQFHEDYEGARESAVAMERQYRGKSDVYLYDVEIPDDDGTNYLAWEKPIPEDVAKKVYNALVDDRWSPIPLENAALDDVGDLQKYIERSMRQTPRTAIAGRSYPKYVSKILSKAGFVGISVPTNFTSIRRRNDDIRNYVIFNESDAKITGNVRFQNDTGETLGFVDRDGSCYIDADNAHVDTPLHEIGIHMLMDAAKQTGEAGLRNAIIEYGRQAPQEFVDRVKNNYGYLWDTMESCRAAVEAEDTAENRKRLEDAEAAFYEEVAAHAFGKAFEDRQAEFAQQNIFQRLLNAIKEFLDRLFNGKYANLDVFDSVEKMGADEIGRKLYDLVMGGKEIADAAGATARAYEGSERRQIIGEKGARNLAEYRGDSTITDNLDTAKRMLAEGRDMLDIKKATGWEYDEGDKHWKTETADAAASSNIEELINNVDLSNLNETFNDGDITLDDLLEDGRLKEELFAAYPILRHWIVSPQTYSPSEGRGKTSIEDGKIVTNLVRGGDGFARKASHREVRGNLIHEIQHVIQYVEGFAAGAAPGKRLNEINNRIKEIDDAIVDAAINGTPFSDLEDERYRLASEAKEIVDKYESYAGEVESRNAERRADMTLEDRLSSTLSSTEDVSGEKSYSFDYSGTMQEVAKQSATTTSAAEEALLAMDGAPARQTAAEWRQWFKDKKIKDKDLMYFLGEGGRRADDEGIDAFDIADYIDHRYRNDNPYSVALRDVAEHGWGRADSKIGRALNLKDGWAMDAIRYLKDAIRAYGAIKENVALYDGNLDSENDFEHLHNTQQSKAGRTIQRFENDIFAPLVEAAAALANKLGVDREMIGNYITALHAPERNKFVTCRKVADEVNEWAAGHGIDVELTADDVMPFYDGNPTAGMDAKVADKIKDVLATKYGTEEARVQSGMTDSEAQQLVSYFENLVNSKGATDELNNMMDNLRLAIAETTTFALDHGLITPEQYDEYTNRYEHYVPLLGFEDEADREAAFDNYRPENRTNTGNVNPNIRRTAQGRKSMSVDPIAGILVRGINTINNGYENDSRMALHKMIMDNPNMKELFFIEGQERPEWAKELFRKGELDDHAVFVYVNGVPTKMYFNGSQGRVLSNGLDNYDTVTRKIARMEEGAVKTVAKAAWDALRSGQAYMSQLTTTFNPIFSLVNLKRDLSFAQRQMFIQHGLRAAIEWDKNFRPSLMACFSYMAMKADTFDVPDAIDEAVRRDASALDEKEIERLANVTGKTKDEVRDLITKAEFNLFIENGGRIGYTSMINDTVAKKRYEKAFKRISEGKSERSLRGKAKDHVDEFAQAFENVSRFAAFKAILEGGSSPSAAAFAAHEVATNLSRRGTQTLFSGVKMFFNATTESLNQMVKNYKSNEKSLLPEQKEQVKTTIRQRQIIVTLANIALSAIATMAMRGLAKALFGGGDDDDEMPNIMSRVPEYRKTTELLIPYKIDEYGRVKALRWHRPFQYRANSYATQKVIEMIAGDTDFGEGMRDIIDAYVEEYLPVSGSPVDRNSEGGLSLSISTFSPDVLKPFFEVAANKSRFGYPIRYTKEDGRSAWSKAKLGTDKTAMAISKALAGGKGTEYKSDAAINISPEVLEYLFKQYTGWIGQTYGWADNGIGMSKSERQRYSQKDPLSSRFFYDGTRDLGYDLVEDWANASEEAKIRAAAALSDDFREIYNVPKESREAMERAALETGYKSYLDMERAVKKLEQGYRRNVKFSQDPSLFPNERKRADEAAIKQLEGIMRLHYEFAKKYYEEIKK